MGIRLATGPVTWGVDFADTPTNPPWTRVLDEIQASGIGALELGPVGFLPEDRATLRDALQSRGLIAAGSFVFDDFHDPDATSGLMQITRRACAAIAAAGGSVLVLIDRPSPDRVAAAGRPDVAPRLSAPRWRTMLEHFRAAASIARRHGLRPVVHPHVGGYVEFQDEIERLLDDTHLDLCLDTGHLAYAGLSADEALTAYAPRLGHVHLKDVRGDVLDRVRSSGQSFWEAINAGIFCPLGEGVVDLTAVLAAIEGAGYEGFATIEQDRVPGSGAPLQELRRSLAVLAAAREPPSAPGDPASSPARALE
jgi:inosose dehydratase